MDKWITRKQFDHMSTKQLLQVGAFNKEKGRHPQPKVEGKTNADYPDKKTTPTIKPIGAYAVRRSARGKGGKGKRGGGGRGGRGGRGN